MNDVVIKVEQVSKKYCKRLSHTMLYGVTDISRRTLGLVPRSNRLRTGEFWAVDDVSFKLRRGEVLGIIGPNGAGKTTILKMLNGIFMPDKGEISIKGRVGALIEIGAGFHPMLTGRENIYINGAILGMSKREIDKKFDAIVDFADIGDFLDSPVKHYSSGMYVRLGFAIAVYCESDILLIDEVLAVGDINFQKKCFDKMREIREKGVSFIFVSHNLYSVEGFCDTVLILDKGKLVHSGNNVSNIIAFYENMAFDRDTNQQIISKRSFENRGTGEINITSVKMMNQYGKQQNGFPVGEEIICEVEIESSVEVENPVYSVALVRIDGLVCGVHRTYFNKNIPPKINIGQSKFRFTIINNQLNSGKYFIGIAIADRELAGQLPYCWRQIENFLVTDPPAPNTDGGCGVFFPHVNWQF